MLITDKNKIIIKTQKYIMGILGTNKLTTTKQRAYNLSQQLGGGGAGGLAAIGASTDKRGGC